MKDPLGVSPSKGNQGTTRGKEKFLLTSVGIEPTTKRNFEEEKKRKETTVKRNFSLPRVVP